MSNCVVERTVDGIKVMVENLNHPDSIARHRNGGFELTKASNGNPSLLYKELTQNVGLDSEQAQAIIRYTYSDEFARKFGQWWDVSSNHSTVLDSNGQPKLFYLDGDFEGVQVLSDQNNGNSYGFINSRNTAVLLGDTSIDTIISNQSNDGFLSTYEGGNKNDFVLYSKDNFIQLGGQPVSEGRFLIPQVKLIVKELQDRGIVGNISFDTQSELDDLITSKYGYEADSNLSGFYDPDTKTVHVNIGKSRDVLDTVLKSMVHPYLDSNPEVLQEAVEMIDSNTDSLKNYFEGVDAEGVELYKEVLNKMISDEGLNIEDSNLDVKFTEWLNDFYKGFGKKLGLRGIEPRQVSRMTLSDVLRSKLSFGNVDIVTKVSHAVYDKRKYDNNVLSNTRFDIESLNIVSEGTDRIVYDLGNGMLLKVATNARGLRQNVEEGSDASDGLLPTVYEMGIDYIVTDKLNPLTNSTKLESGINGKTFLDDMKIVAKETNRFSSKSRDVLAKYDLLGLVDKNIVWSKLGKSSTWGVNSDGTLSVVDGSVLNADISRENDEPLTKETFKEIFDSAQSQRRLHIGPEINSFGIPSEYTQRQIEYAIIRNNGLELEFAPNGKQSNAWVQLNNAGLSREKSYEILSQMYTDSFIQKYGDWLNGDYNATLDENGQPTILWQGRKDGDVEGRAYTESTIGKTENSGFANESFVTAMNYAYGFDVSHPSIRRRLESHRIGNKVQVKPVVMSISNVVELEDNDGFNSAETFGQFINVDGTVGKSWNQSGRAFAVRNHDQIIPLGGDVLGDIAQFQRATDGIGGAQLSDVVSVVEMLSSQTGVAVVVTNNNGEILYSSAQVISPELLNATKNNRGLYSNSTAYLNIDKMTPDTPYHEIVGHVVINHLRNSGSKLYDSFAEEVYAKHSGLINETATKYPELNEAEVVDEVIVQLFGEYMAGNAGLKPSLFRRLITAIKNMVNKFLGKYSTLDLSTFNSNIGISEFAQKLSIDRRPIKGVNIASEYFSPSVRRSNANLNTRFPSISRLAFDKLAERLKRPYNDEFENGISVITNKSEYNSIVRNMNKDNAKYHIGAFNEGVKSIQETEVEKNQIISEAKANGTYMKAPNGKPTNLNEDQWVTVRTTNFKEWFGDWENNPKDASKVVDENGEPLVMYHGTEANFNEFDYNKIGTNASVLGYGFYLTPSKDLASMYGNLIPLFVNSKQPIVESDKSLTKAQLKKFIGEVVKLEQEANEYDDFKDGFMSNYPEVYSMSKSAAIDYVAGFYANIGDSIVDQIAELANMTSPEIANKAMVNSLGYDSIFKSDFEGMGDVYVALNPNQIKSATSNVGTYSSRSNDIRYRNVSNSSNSTVIGRAVDQLINLLKRTFLAKDVVLDASVFEQTLPEEEFEDARMRIGNKRKEEMRNLLTKNRPDLIERNEIESTIDAIEKFGEEEAGEKGDSKLEKLALHWVIKSGIRLPEDGYAIRQAARIASQKKIDPMSFDNPKEIIDKYASEVKGERLDPDKEPMFTDRREVPGTNIVTYEVKDSKEGQKAVRRMIDTHFGKDANPWCVAARVDGDVKKSWDYWKKYSSYPKRIAFDNGKLMAFSANEYDEVIWWDRQDKPGNGLPVHVRLGEGKRQTLFYAEDGSITEKSDIEQGDKENGTYRKWSSEEVLLEESNWKDGVLDGKYTTYHPNGNIEFDGNYVDGMRDGIATLYHKNGKLYTQWTYSNGRVNGAEIRWNAEGQKISESIFRNGNIVGVSREWDDNGTLVVMIQRSDDGSEISTKLWYPNGGIKYEYTTIDYKNHGMFRHWSEDGTLLKEGNWNHGKEDGVHRQWDNSGTLRREIEYKNGLIVGTQRVWDDEGILTNEVNYSDKGNKHGLVRQLYGEDVPMIEEVWDDGVLKSRKVWDYYGNLTQDDRYFRKPNGDVYGFVTSDNVIYLNPSKLDLNTPIHEFAHLWNDLIKKSNKSLWDEGAKLVRKSPYYDTVRNNPDYAYLDDNGIIDEALATAIGDRGENLISAKGITKTKFQLWIQKVWDYIKSLFGGHKETTLEDFTDKALSELLGGKPLVSNNVGGENRLHTTSGIVYGAKLSNGTIYVNPDYLNAETLIHEFAHIWEQMMPSKFSQGVEILKKTNLGVDTWNELRNNSGYDNYTDEELWSEALITILGKKGAELYHSEGKSKLADWVRDLFKSLSNLMNKLSGGLVGKSLTPEDTLETFVSGALSDIMGGKKVKAEVTTKPSTNAIDYHLGESEKFDDLVYVLRELNARIGGKSVIVNSNGEILFKSEASLAVDDDTMRSVIGNKSATKSGVSYFNIDLIDETTPYQEIAGYNIVNSLATELNNERLDVVDDVYDAQDFTYHLPTSLIHNYAVNEGAPDDMSYGVSPDEFDELYHDAYVKYLLPKGYRIVTYAYETGQTDYKGDPELQDYPVYILKPGQELYDVLDKILDGPYFNLKEALLNSDTGRVILDKVSSAYPNLSGQDLINEAMVHAIGSEFKDLIEERKSHQNDLGLIIGRREFERKIKETLASKGFDFSTFDIRQEGTNGYIQNFRDLAEVAVYSGMNIVTDSYTYTRGDLMKYITDDSWMQSLANKTAQDIYYELSNHFRSEYGSKGYVDYVKKGVLGYISEDDGYITTDPDDGLFRLMYDLQKGRIDLTEKRLKLFRNKNIEYLYTDDIIQEWKRENNVEYNVQDLTDIGHGIYHYFGAYNRKDSMESFDMIINSLETGVPVELSALIEPVMSENPPVNNTEIRIRLFPESDDILYAGNRDVYSGSRWDSGYLLNDTRASYKKSPSDHFLPNIRPSLQDAVFDRNYDYSEVGVRLQPHNFWFEATAAASDEILDIVDELNDRLNAMYPYRQNMLLPSDVVWKEEVGAKDIRKEVERRPRRGTASGRTITEIIPYAESIGGEVLDSYGLGVVGRKMFIKTNDKYYSFEAPKSLNTRPDVDKIDPYLIPDAYSWNRDGYGDSLNDAYFNMLGVDTSSGMTDLKYDDSNILLDTTPANITMIPSSFGSDALHVSKSIESPVFEELKSIPGLSEEQALDIYKNIYSDDHVGWKDPDLKC